MRGEYYLLVQTEDCLLVDVVAGGDDHVLEPLQLVLAGYPLHRLPDQ